MAHKQLPPHKHVVIGAIAGIVFLETIALLKGINGTMFSLALAAVAGLAGWTAPQLGPPK